MKKSSPIGRYLCQLLMLALIGYGLNLGCILQSDGCPQESTCCIGCALPAHLEKASDHTVHLKLGPALLPTETLSLAAVVTTLGEVELYVEAESPPQMLSFYHRDPVRGPPLA